VPCIARVGAVLGFSSLCLCGLDCSHSANGTLSLNFGEETDTLTRAPAIVKLRVDSVDSAGKAKTLATTSLPASALDLGWMNVDATGTFRVVGFDSGGNALVAGQSLPIAFGIADGQTLPIFVQRVGELALLPHAPAETRLEPTLAAAVGGRYVFIGAGSDPTASLSLQLYDIFELTAVKSPPKLPRAPKSVAFVGAVAWLIDEMGATQYDLSTGASADVVGPLGGSYAEIAGGATVVTKGGSQYVVGATRTAGAATNKILALDASGNPSWLTLTTPRLGASAAWSDTTGLVVAGGSAAAPGVEIVDVVRAAATTGSPLAYPPDPSVGAGAAPLDGDRFVLLAGGTMPDGSDAGVRVVDLSCASQCAPTSWTALPTVVTSAQAFSIDDASAVIVGSEPSSAVTHVFRVTSGNAAEIPTRAPHHGARAIASPIGPRGSVLLAGGAPKMESFQP
jgi:hypothetical protein